MNTFQEVQQGNIIYILQKGEKPILEEAVVVRHGDVKPQFNLSSNAAMGLNVNNTIEIVAKVGEGERILQNLPAGSNTFTYPNGTFVSCDRLAMLAKVDEMLNQSKQVLDSIDYHKTVVEECDVMLRRLNPSYEKEKQRDERMDSFERGLQGLTAMMSQMQKSLDKLVTKK